MATMNQTYYCHVTFPVVPQSCLDVRKNWQVFVYNFTTIWSGTRFSVAVVPFKRCTKYKVLQILKFMLWLWKVSRKYNCVPSTFVGQLHSIGQSGILKCAIKYNIHHLMFHEPLAVQQKDKQTKNCNDLPMLHSNFVHKTSIVEWQSIKFTANVSTSSQPQQNPSTTLLTRHNHNASLPFLVGVKGRVRVAPFTPWICYPDPFYPYSKMRSKKSHYD